MNKIDNEEDNKNNSTKNGLDNIYFANNINETVESKLKNDSNNCEIEKSKPISNQNFQKKTLKCSNYDLGEDNFEIKYKKDDKRRYSDTSLVKNPKVFDNKPKYQQN